MHVQMIGAQHGVGLHVAHCLAQMLTKVQSMGLATGGTMEPLYRAIVQLQRSSELDLAGVRRFWGLDEYLGLPQSHPRSYWTELQELFFAHLPDGDYSRFAFNSDVGEDDVHGMCQQIEALLRDSGGIDLQLLGIGENGHIGFNEPGSAFDSRCRCIELCDSTRRANRRFFGGDLSRVPTHAATMGIGTILDAKNIWLLATGEKKAQAVRDAIEGPISEDCPASALQMHDNVCFFLDEAAASLVVHRDRIVTVS